MEKTIKSRLDDTSKMLSRWAQEIRLAIKRENAADALRYAREVLNMAGWVITYSAATLSVEAMTATLSAEAMTATGNHKTKQP